MGHFTCFTKKMPQTCAKSFGLCEQKASAYITHMSEKLRLAKSCMPSYWLGHFSGCWSAERPQLSNFASRSKELSSLEGEHSSIPVVSSWVEKKMGHMLLPFDHGIMEHAHHARAIAHRILGYPGTHNPCEPSSPARKLEIANALLWCWYWHSWALPGCSSSQIRQISESSLFYILHFFRIFLFGGLTVLPSDLAIIGFDQARFSSCLKIHQFWDQITTFTNQGLWDMLFGAGLVT